MHGCRLPVGAGYAVEFGTDAGGCCGNRITTTADQRGSPRAPNLTSHGGDPMPSLIGLREELAMLRSISRDADARWRAMRNDPPEFSLGGRDITAPAMDRLEPLVRRSVPWLAVERAGVARALDVLQPRRLVLASDQHRVGRLAVDLARERGIRTVVLQHGHPMGSLGYLPVFADSLATWSERSDAWVIAGGTDPARLIRLGNPRLDKLAVADRALQTASVTQRTGLRGAPRILLGAQPERWGAQSSPARSGA